MQSLSLSLSHFCEGFTETFSQQFDSLDRKHLIRVFRRIELKIPMGFFGLAIELLEIGLSLMPVVINIIEDYFEGFKFFNCGTMNTTKPHAHTYMNMLLFQDFKVLRF